MEAAGITIRSADGIQVVKKECITHVQKQVSPALKKLKKKILYFVEKGNLLMP